MADFKQEIRAGMKELEARFPAEKASAETEAFWTAVERSKEFSSAGTVLVYMAIQGEIPTDGFIRKWSGLKRIAIPKVAGDRLELREYSPSRLQPGYKGIPEPTEEAAAIAAEEIDFAIIPGVAFAEIHPDGQTDISADKNINETARRYKRLGRGKGFYDKLLPLLHCPRIPAGYSFRFLDDLPTENHDIVV